LCQSSRQGHGQNKDIKTGTNTQLGREPPWRTSELNHPRAVENTRAKHHHQTQNPAKHDGGEVGREGEASKA